MSSTGHDVARPAPTLRAEETAVLAAVADHLIPAAHGMPSAADIVPGDRLRFVLASRPDLFAPLRGAVRAELGPDPSARLERLAAEDPVQLMALQLVVVGAYYTDGRVRELLGYPGQLAKPVNAHDYPEYVAEGLIDAVVARGPIWRDPHTTGSGGS